MADIEPVEATKIKPGSKVTVELECVFDYGLPAVDVRFPGGQIRTLPRQFFADLPWLPPAPVLRVGGRAAVSGLIVRNGLPETVEVRAIDDAWAMVKWVDGTCSARRVSDLTPLEDEG